MKRLLLLAFSMGLFQLSQAQTTEPEKTLRETNTDSTMGWKKGGLIALNFAQASFSNWAAGGQNSLSANGLVSVFASYKKNNSYWGNMLDLGYGILQQGKKGKVLKTDDKIDLTSKFGTAATKTWNYAALLNFKTQMAPGYNYPDDTTKISDLLAPAYLIAALGMEYKPKDNFSAFLAPVTAKITIVNNTALADAGAYGVEPASATMLHGKKMRTEFGGYVRMVYKNNFAMLPNVSLLTKLELFSNYLENPQNVDVNWETIIGFKVNKYISATLNTNLIYDNDIKIAVDKNKDGIQDGFGPRVQFKELIGIGLSCKF